MINYNGFLIKAFPGEGDTPEFVVYFKAEAGDKSFDHTGENGLLFSEIMKDLTYARQREIVEMVVKQYIFWKTTDSQ
jgi:hypothetical protein